MTSQWRLLERWRNGPATDELVSAVRPRVRAYDTVPHEAAIAVASRLTHTDKADQVVVWGLPAGAKRPLVRHLVARWNDNGSDEQERIKP
ncbi:hypothetical protein [Microbaculum marinum]|uniref:Uncharacterized protein n=1 Tax=Microbaculum marinum TaxID=1764581 RepID=A0AAW9RLN8_9HYPH